jgi:SPP1 family predicted phage head-tail adaptor
MNAGKYRHRIDFLKRSKGRDDYGEPVEVWKSFVSGVWASFDPLLGNEYFTAYTTNSKVEVKYNCRYIKGITNDMRIQHGDEVYEILSAVNVKGLNRELLCYCRKVK